MAGNPFAEFIDMVNDNKGRHLDDEYCKIEDVFYELFGHRAPREMIPDGIDTEQIKSAMKICIENKEDNLLKLLNIEIDKDILV